jgi:hypothetical protein
VRHLFVEFKKVYDSVKRKVLYNFLIEFGIPTKLLNLTKMCRNETYNRVRLGKYLSDMFPIKNGLIQGHASCSLLLNFALEYTIMKFR